MRSLLGLICLAGLLSSYDPAPEFAVKGIIRNGPSNGMAYVRYFRDNGRVMDSGSITNGQFTVKGNLTAGPVIGKVWIQAPGEAEPKPENQSEIFLEPGTIQLKIDKDLSNPQFSGSTAQEEFTTLYQAQRSVRAGFRLLDEAYTEAEAKKDLEKKDLVLKQYDSVGKVNRGIIKNFISSHPGSMISVYKFDDFMGYDVIDVSEVESVYASLSPDLKSLPKMKKSEKRLAIAKQTAVGQPAILFSQKDTSGNLISLASFRGKYLLVDFWSSWCVPCRAENPNLIKNYEKFKSRGLEILGVSLDGNRKPWVTAIVKDGLTWPQVSDLKVFDNEVAKMYGIESIPQNILIDPDGKIVAKNLRGGELNKKLETIFK